MAVRARDGVGPEDHLEAFGVEAVPKDPEDQRHRQRHLGKPCFGVIPDPQVLGLVVEVILENQVEVGIEIRAMLGHQPERGLVQQRAVLDRRTPGGHRPANAFDRVGVDHRAAALLPGLATGRQHLFLRERRGAPLTNAGRCENLDDVGSIGDAPSDDLANVVGTQGRIDDGIERSDDSGSGESSARDRVTECPIQGGTSSIPRTKSTSRAPRDAISAGSGSATSISISRLRRRYAAQSSTRWSHS